MSLKILIPYDGSEFSHAVFETVKRVFTPQRDQVVLLQVAPIPEELEEESSGVPSRWAEQVDYRHASDTMKRVLEPDRSAYVERIWKQNKTRVLKEMEEVKRELAEAGFAVETVVRFGDAVQEISDFVELEQVDMVAMATHGRSGLTRLVMGSVAEKVLRSLHVPVMMVRPERTFAEEMLPVTEIADAMA